MKWDVARPNINDLFVEAVMAVILDYDGEELCVWEVGGDAHCGFGFLCEFFDCGQVIGSQGEAHDVFDDCDIIVGKG